jgi:hypothetical protein
VRLVEWWLSEGGIVFLVLRGKLDFLEPLTPLMAANMLDAAIVFQGSARDLLRWWTTGSVR